MQTNGTITTCQTSFTVKHFLIECRDFAFIRLFFSANHMNNDILSFLRKKSHQKIININIITTIQSNHCKIIPEDFDILKQNIKKKKQICF